MAVTLWFSWAFAKIDAYSHFTVLILISWLKFKTTSKMTTEEQKEPEVKWRQWRQQEQEQSKKGILSKNNAVRVLLKQDIWFRRYLRKTKTINDLLAGAAGEIGYALARVFAARPPFSRLCREKRTPKGGILKRFLPILRTASQFLYHNFSHAK